MSTFIWAHRGASGHEIDNTLESFRLAIEMGADGLESDVHITKDGELIFFHDDKIEFSGTPISPSKLTLKEIQSIDLGNRRRVPTVEEIFVYFKDKKNAAGQPIRYSLDIKTLDMGFPLIELAEKIGIAQYVELTPNDNYPRFWSTVRKYRVLSPEIQIVNSAHFQMKLLKVIFKRMYYQKWDKAEQYRLKGINLKAAYATSQVIQDIKNHNLLVYVWDCHSESTIAKFMNLSVDAIYTNYPDVAVKIRESMHISVKSK